MTYTAQIEAALEDNTVVCTRAYRGLATAASRLAARGWLVEMLPSVYARAEHADLPEVRLAAVALWSPEATCVGVTAAALARGDVPAPPFHFAAPRYLVTPSWLAWHRRFVPPEERRTFCGLACASPGLVAVELAAYDQGHALFEALRGKQVRVDALPALLSTFRGTRGQAERSRVVEGCLRKPWSFAEARLHSLLLQHGYTDWVANHEFRVGSRRLVADVYFPKANLILEFDSWEFHGGERAFGTDRVRMNDLAILRLRHAHVTWEMLNDKPDELIALVRLLLDDGDPGDAVA